MMPRLPESSTPNPIAAAKAPIQPVQEGLDLFDEVIHKNMSGQITRLFNGGTTSAEVQNSIGLIYKRYDMQAFDDLEFEEMSEFLVLLEDVKMAQLSPFDSKGEFRAEIKAVAKAANFDTALLKKLEEFCAALIVGATKLATENNAWLAAVLNTEDSPNRLKNAVDKFGEELVFSQLISACIYSISETVTTSVSKPVPGTLIGNFETMYLSSLTELSSKINALKAIKEMTGALDYLLREGQRISTALFTDPFTDTADFIAQANEYLKNPQAYIAKLEKATASYIAPLGGRIADAFNTIYSIDDIAPRSVASAMLEYPQPATFASSLGYIFSGKFIFAPVKNILKLVSEFIPGIIRETILWTMDHARKAYADASDISNPVARVTAKAFFGAGVIVTGAAYGIARGVTMLTSRVTSPMRTFRAAWNVNPALGLLSAVTTVVATSAVAFFAAPLVLGALAATGIPVISTAVSAVSKALSTVGAFTANLPGVSSVPYLTNNLAALGMGVLGGAYAVVASPLKYVASKIWTNQPKVARIALPVGAMSDTKIEATLAKAEAVWQAQLKEVKENDGFYAPNDEPESPTAIAASQRAQRKTESAVSPDELAEVKDLAEPLLEDEEKDEKEEIHSSTVKRIDLSNGNVSVATSPNTLFTHPAVDANQLNDKVKKAAVDISESKQEKRVK